MIDRNKVEYIIDSFKKSKKNTPDNSSKLAGDLNISDLVMSDERKTLHKYISELNSEELCDLVGLMSFGREIYQHEKNIEGIGSFNEFRRNAENSLKDQAPAHTAFYLLGKALLDKYLQCACEMVY